VPLHVNTRLSAAPHLRRCGRLSLIVDSSDGVPENVLAALRDSPGLQIITHCSDRTWTARWRYRQPEMSRLWYVDGSGSSGSTRGWPPANDDQKSARWLHHLYIREYGYTQGSVDHSRECLSLHRESPRDDQTAEATAFSEFSAMSFDFRSQTCSCVWKSGRNLYVPTQSEAL